MQSPVKANILFVLMVIIAICSLFMHIDIPFTPITIWVWQVYLAMFLVRFIPIKIPTPQNIGYSFWLCVDRNINVLASTLMLSGSNPTAGASSRVGYWAKQDHKPALILEKIIDTIWYVLTGLKGHCRTPSR